MENRISRDLSPHVTHSVKPASDASEREQRADERQRQRRRRKKSPQEASAVVELSSDAEREAPAGEEEPGVAGGQAEEASPPQDAPQGLDARGRKLDIRV